MHTTAVAIVSTCWRCGRPLSHRQSANDICLRCERIMEKEACRTLRRRDIKDKAEVASWARV